MPEITREFFVEDFTVPGAEFSKLPELPDPKLFENNDVIILWCFGNSYIKSKPFRLPNKRFPNEQFINHRNEVITTKKIHLPEFVPASNTKILKEFETAKVFLQQTKCKVFVIDPPYRHMRCCEEHSIRHRAKGLFKFQRDWNRHMKIYFQDLENVTVLDHRILLGLGSERYTLGFYERLLPDSVHLEDELYQRVIEILHQKYIR